MKTIMPLGLIAGLFLAASTVHANPQADVSSPAWAMAAVKHMAARGIMQAKPDGKFHGERPVTRYELAVVLDRLVHYIKASRQQPASRPSSIPKQALINLSSGGFISSQSPLLQGDKVVTAQELAAVLSQVTIRLSEDNTPAARH